ncbi:hypothetical protein EYC80_009744 [Monilinia laxa]|uniref:Ent-kaurene synthase n=1 Tax=Monilinia laxa TaxID=61186 RepID=A0A5N6JT68_MONLA|nr:hypothetical protein EYC80_009744 [Monilinia laxa]
MAMAVTLNGQAQELLHEVAINSQHGFGTLSAAVYDTAWVAMVEKQENGTNTTVFPECFDFLKKTQSPKGSWDSVSSDIDVIINTLAALLALKRQAKQDIRQRDDNNERCHRAETALRIVLARWDIAKTDRVGFEILIPNLLKLLEVEGIYFDFPSRAKLMSLGDAKLGKLRPVLTGSDATTLLHSLEAFTGSLDFNNLQHHKMPGGSMFGSPSSTAAYLMNSSVWDSEAETYLRSVPTKQVSSNYLHGGFPSAFPTTIFETVWVTAALLDSGFTTQDFLPERLDAIKDLLKVALENQGGIVGFAPGFLADADDTAKSISVLSKLGYNAPIEPMLTRFEAHSCFLTYHGERNQSISANCNVLMCLLQSPQPSAYAAQISKCTTYIIDICMTGNMQDKWNISEQYSFMLIAQALILLIEKKEFDRLLRVSVSLILPGHYILPILLDILTRTMQLQQKDGSWEAKHEVTAYSILTITSLLRLPLPSGVDAYMENVIEPKYKSKLQEIKTIISKLCERYGCISQDKARNGEKIKDMYTPQDSASCAKDYNKHDTNKKASMMNDAVLNRNGKHNLMDLDSIISELDETNRVLEAFVAHILHHPQVLKAHHSLRSWLKYELETFLLAHVTHIEDCYNLSSGMSPVFTLRAPRSTYYNWVSTTGADHTSCTYSFVFYLCLATQPGENPTTSAHQRFLLEDACHSLATICRQYNDFGSVARDRQEENLNSINFPEFDDGIEIVDEHDSEETEGHRKQDLLAIAKYKRRILDSILQDLEEFLNPNLMSKLKLFVDVTDLYGQIYVARDIGIRKV